jgi:hypothetical protein
MEPVVATGGNWSQIALPPKPQKQAKTVAVGCDWLPREVMVSRASAVGCHPLREVPSLRGRRSISLKRQVLRTRRPTGLDRATLTSKEVAVKRGVRKQESDQLSAARPLVGRVASVPCV